jgi:hypothetical protein
MAEFRDVRGADQFQYRDRILAAKKRWDEYSDTEKELLRSVVFTLVEDFLLWWDTLKAIEKKFNIDVWGIAREERWKHSFDHGQRLAKKFHGHGTRDVYDAWNSTFEALTDPIWIECNDRCFHKWNRNCPCFEAFKELGRTDDEIKELAPLFCLADLAIMSGVNPELEVFPQTRLLMAGDDHCTYHWEDNRAEKIQ